MTTQNNRLTPGLSNNLVQSDGVTKTQKQTIFENMSDGIITVTADGLINYVNSAATQIFDLSEESLVGQSFAETLLSSRKNKAFNRLFKKCSKKNCPSSKETATYTTPEGQKHLRITISLVKQSTGADSEYGMLILIEDISDAENLKQHERDCALLFAGIVICITLYLSAWSLIRFTFHIPLKASFYTLMIEAMTLILFLEIIFFTSFSLKDVGLIPRRKMFFQYKAKQRSVFCNSRTVAKLFLRVLGARSNKTLWVALCMVPLRIYSLHCCRSFFSTIIVIQTSVKTYTCQTPDPGQHLFDVDALYVNASSLWFYFHDGCFFAKHCARNPLRTAKNNLGLLLPTLEHRLPSHVPILLRSRHSSFPYPTISHGHILLIMSKAAIHFAVPRD